jgi:acyl-CoA oxidase
MLMKHTKVLRDGKVIDPPLAQLSYGALIQGRVAMVVDSGNTAKKAMTIALRFAAVRRQFASTGKSTETKLLDYAIHMHRLIPLLAQTLAMHFTGVQTDKMFIDLMDKLDTAGPKDDMKPLIETLKETHATSAGLKAHCTWATLNIIEQCRQSLGGHGYSDYNELAPMLKNWVVQCTWEGDNTILTLQSGRYLVGCYRDAQQGKKLAPGVAYLNELNKNLQLTCSYDPQNIMNEVVFAEAFSVVAAHAVHRAAKEFERALGESKGDIEEAHERCAPARFTAAKVHCIGSLYHKFADGVRSAPPSLAIPLRTLLLVYGAHSCGELAGEFLQTNYFTKDHMAALRSHLDKYIKMARKEAICMVDSFNLTDYVINSPFGRYDGDIYTHYVAQVKRLNPPMDKHPYFETRIKPLLTRSMDMEDFPDLDE